MLKLLFRSIKSAVAHERKVRSVLKAFERMGATRRDLEVERARLSADGEYLAEWLVAINPPRKHRMLP